MMDEHTTIGKAALICGAISLVFCWLGFLGLVIAIIAIILGGVSWSNDKYGKYAVILGIVAIVLSFVVSALIYVYISSMLAAP